MNEQINPNPKHQRSNVVNIYYYYAIIIDTKVLSSFKF